MDNKNKVSFYSLLEKCLIILLVIIIEYLIGYYLWKSILVPILNFPNLSLSDFCFV